MDLDQLKLRLLKRMILPPEVCSGPGSLERLGILEPGSRVLVLMSGSAARSAGLAQFAKRFRSAADCRVLHWSGEEPSASLIAPVREAVLDFMPNWMVGVGGGAVLDAAKFVRAQYQHPDQDWSRPVEGLRNGRFVSRLALVPTTSGSGSEASQAVVLADPDGRKTPYVSSHFVADLVILDPAVTVGLAPMTWVNTGFDALAHAVEAAVSPASSALLRSLAAVAIRAVLAHLPEVVCNPSQSATREALQTAAFLGGLCQSTASTGAAHALSHATSALYRTPHAPATAIFLPHVMRWNYARKRNPFDALAVECGLPDGDALVAAITELARHLRVPARITEFLRRGLTDQELEDLARVAVNDVCLRTNPCRMGVIDLVELMRAFR